MMRAWTLVFACLLCAGFCSSAAGAQEWEFRVWLDDKEIGRHEFVLQDRGDELQLESRASFEYRLLFVRLYEYQHNNTETWRNGCLERLDSKTDANGKDYAVQGARRDSGFVVKGSEGDHTLPDCVMSFAYWNPRFLQQDRLLNSQNGEYIEVEVSEPRAEELEVRGIRRPARRYDLQAGDMNIRLWYSLENEWLALETDARGGRVLRYELL